MKTIKGVAIFLFFCILFGSCFSPPEFSLDPSISYNDIYFKEGKVSSDADTLILIIEFQDGDGDLGLYSELIDDPYHPFNFYLKKDNGDTIPLATETNLQYTDMPPFIKVPSGVSGQLVTVRTPGYPPFICPFTKISYLYDSVYVSETDEDIFDSDDHNVARFRAGRSGVPGVFVLLDTFFYKTNPTHYNIEVDFWIKQSNGQFREFDWGKDQCTDGFDARFPILTDSENPLEGTLKYSMTSVGFNPLFAGKIMKLSVRIRDRSLHRSNVIETPEFTLEKIRK